MALVNSSVTDITADTLLSQSKTKIKGNDDKLLANDVAVEARLVTAESNLTAKTDMLGTSSAGSTSGWYDEKGDISVKGAGANDPAFSGFLGGIFAYGFSPTVMKEVFINFHINHDYMPATKVYLHTHWSTLGTNTGVVRWGFEFTVAKGHNQGNFPATTTVYVETAAQGTSARHIISETSLADAVAATNLEPDSVIMCRVFRDAAHANDTCTDFAYLLFADCHYQTDRHTSKNKAPNFYT